MANEGRRTNMHQVHLPTNLEMSSPVATPRCNNDNVSRRNACNLVTDTPTSPVSPFTVTPKHSKPDDVGATTLDGFGGRRAAVMTVQYCCCAANMASRFVP